MAGPKSIHSRQAGLRASGNGFASTMVPTRMSTARKVLKSVVGEAAAAGSWGTCIMCPFGRGRELRSQYCRANGSFVQHRSRSTTHARGTGLAQHHLRHQELRHHEEGA